MFSPCMCIVVSTLCFLFIKLSLCFLFSFLTVSTLFLFPLLAISSLSIITLTCILQFKNLKLITILFPNNTSLQNILIPISPPILHIIIARYFCPIVFIFIKLWLFLKISAHLNLHSLTSLFVHNFLHLSPFFWIQFLSCWKIIFKNYFNNGP